MALKGIRTRGRSSPLGQRAHVTSALARGDTKSRPGSRSGAQLASPSKSPAAGLRQQAPATAEGVLTLSKVSAANVANADAQDSGCSDPYVRFTLLAPGEGEALSTASTSHKMNTLNPSWDAGEEYTLRVPHGAAPTLHGSAPTLRVEVLDKDFKSDDEVLCSGSLQLALSLQGSATRLALRGQNGYHDGCTVSFTYAGQMPKVRIGAEARRSTPLQAGDFMRFHDGASNCLYLGSKDLCPADAASLSTTLSSGVLLSLEGLSLGDNQLGDQGLATLAPSVRALPQLRQLSLNSNGIADEGVAALLASGAGALGSLESLDLSCNPITDASCALIVSALRRGELPALLVLAVFNTLTTDRERAAVQAAISRAVFAR